jgi:hypothetical protein
VGTKYVFRFSLSTVLLRYQVASDQLRYPPQKPIIAQRASCPLVAQEELIVPATAAAEKSLPIIDPPQQRLD